jgi:two-component system cell cycle response regulator
VARRKRILVVDDNPLTREILEEVLGEEYNIMMAANGPDALLLAARYHPHVVLLDVMLPGVDGYCVCRKMRAMPNMSGVWIVMVTAKAMPSERKQGLEAGADAYLTKPFDDADLINSIRVADAVDHERPCIS